jgi:hypothetical protein
MRMRPTILGLMGLIAFIAVGMAVIRSNDELGAAVILALTVSALCTATLVAIHRRGAWAGFAVFGWAQFLICQPHSAPSTARPTSLPTGIAYRFLPNVTTQPPMAQLILQDQPPIWTDAGGKSYLLTVTDQGIIGVVPLYSLCALLCLSSLVVGFIGAIVGGFIARRDFSDGDRPA